MDDLGKSVSMATAHVVLKIFDQRRKDVTVLDPAVWQESCVRTACLYFFVPRQERYIRECEKRIEDAVTSLQCGEMPYWLERAAAFIEQEAKERKKTVAQLLACI